MGALFNPPKPPAIPTPPPAAAAPTLANPEIAASGAKRAAAAMNQEGTVQTTAQGLKDPTNTAKSLLGNATK